MPEITTIILTGGAATRMQPLSFDKSKSMIPYLGAPLLFYLLQALEEHRFLDLVFSSAGKKDEVKNYFGDGKRFGVNIRYGNGDNFRGTAGTTKDLIDRIRGEISDPFMLIYGDSLLKANYGEMFAFHRAKKSPCTILYHRPNFASFLYEYHDKSLPERDKRTNFGVMNLEADNKITKVIEKPTLEEIKQEFTNPVANAVVYILKKEILNFIPTVGLFDFPRDLFPILIQKEIPCFGFDVGGGYRLDIGTIPHYYNFQLAMLEGKIAFDLHYPAVKEGVWVGQGTTIESINKLRRPVLIGANSRIGANSVIDYSIIGNNVSVGYSSSVIRSIILDNARIGSRARIAKSIIGGNSVIGDGVAVPPNTVLGNFCHLRGPELIMNDSELYGLIRGSNTSG